MNDADKSKFVAWIESLSKALKDSHKGKTSFLIRARNKKEAVELLDSMIEQGKSLMKLEEK